MDNLDCVAAVAPAGCPQVAEPGGLLDGELAGDAGDVEPLRELVNCDEWDDGARDDVGSAVGKLLPGGPDEEESGLGGHRELKMVVVVLGKGSSSQRVTWMRLPKLRASPL